MARKLPSVKKSGGDLKGSTYLKEYLKEKFDPRNMLFSGGGLGSAIGRSVFGKGYSMGDSYKKDGVKAGSTLSSPTAGGAFSEQMAADAQLTAKNSMVLPNMARDMNIMKLNIMKLVKQGGGKATSGTDMFWKQAGGRESAYESAIAKIKGSIGIKTAPKGLIVGGKDVDGGNPVPVKVVEGKSDMEDGITSMFKGNALRGLISGVTGILTSPIFLAAAGSAALLALYVRALKNVPADFVEKVNKDVSESAASSSGEAKTIMDVHEQTSDIERRRMNILASRTGDDWSLNPFKDSDLQKKYLAKIGFDEKTGLTADEIKAGYTGIDDKGQPVKKQTSPTPSPTQNSSAPGAAPTTAPTTTGQSSGGGASQFDSSVQNVLATIRQKESGGNYQAQAKGSSASGAYQFIDKTWQSLTQKYGVGAEFKKAKDAPPEIQDSVAGKYVQDILQKNGGDVSKVPLVWYTGNAQGKMSAEAIAANNGLTAEGYQQKWMASYNKISGGAGGTALAATKPAMTTASTPSSGSAVSGATKGVSESKTALASAPATNNVVNNTTNQVAGGGGSKGSVAPPYDKDLFDSLFGRQTSIA